MYEDEEILEKDKRRAKRRKKDFAKAIRKRNILKLKLYKYSKNKVRRSRQLRKFKSVYNPDNKTHSDMKKLLSTEFKMLEFVSG